MKTTYRLIFTISITITVMHQFTFSFSFFTGQLFNSRVVIVFGFHLSPFGLHLNQYLGLRLCLIGYIYFQHFIYLFIAFHLVLHHRWVETCTQEKPI